jgi:hypothetical protein
MSDKGKWGLILIAPICMTNGAQPGRFPLCRVFANDTKGLSPVSDKKGGVFPSGECDRC